MAVLRPLIAKELAFLYLAAKLRKTIVKIVEFQQILPLHYVRRT